LSLASGSLLSKLAFKSNLNRYAAVRLPAWSAHLGHGFDVHAGAAQGWHGGAVYKCNSGLYKWNSVDRRNAGLYKWNSVDRRNSGLYKWNSVDRRRLVSTKAHRFNRKRLSFQRVNRERNGYKICFQVQLVCRYTTVGGMWMGVDFTTGMKNQRVSRTKW
jgi:hypothetical protein